MNADGIQETISLAAHELQAAGLSALYLFGSQARGDAGADSDIDLAFDVREGARFSLLDQAKLQMRLQDLLDRHVDFVSRDGMRSRMRSRVEAEMIRLL